MKGIRVLKNVRFKLIPLEMLHMFYAVMKAAALQRGTPTITGAAFEGYPVGKVHDAGYAIDVRVSDIEHPAQYASDIRKFLSAVSRHYAVLYGDSSHLDHIHIGFAWSYSSEAHGG